MTVSYAGSLTLGQCCPLAVSASVALGSAAGTAMPDIQARLAGLLTLSVQPPPSIPQLIAGLQQTLFALQGMLVVPPLPDLPAFGAAIAELQAAMLPLKAALALQGSLTSVLGSPGIRFYSYAGEAGDLGPELAGTLSGGLPGGGGPNETVAGVILLANDAGAISALRKLFRSP